MNVWLSTVCSVLLLFGAAGCTRTPTVAKDLTPEEEERLEKELRRRVEQEGEGSTRRAAEEETKDPTRTPASKKRP
jgi:hypothetical protein